MTMEQLALELLALPARARAKLAQKLLASLEDDGAADEVDTLWAAEAELRLNQVKDGSVEVRPAAEVIHEARSRLKR